MIDEIEIIRDIYKYAINYSDDPNTKNGAALLTINGDIIYEANKFPKGISVSEERLVRPAKYKYIEHAERGVLYRAAQLGLVTEGSTLYCPWFACSDCSRGIVCCGVREIVGHIPINFGDHPYWKDECIVGHQILSEAGINIRYLPEGTTFGLQVLRNGVLIQV